MGCILQICLFVQNLDCISVHVPIMCEIVVMCVKVRYTWSCVCVYKYVYVSVHMFVYMCACVCVDVCLRAYYLSVCVCICNGLCVCVHKAVYIDRVALLYILTCLDLFELFWEQQRTDRSGCLSVRPVRPGFINELINSDTALHPSSFLVILISHLYGCPHPTPLSLYLINTLTCAQ